jgi:hypothetical protein
MRHADANGWACVCAGGTKRCQAQDLQWDVAYATRGCKRVGPVCVRGGTKHCQARDLQWDVAYATRGCKRVGRCPDAGFESRDCSRAWASRRIDGCIEGNFCGWLP